VTITGWRIVKRKYAAIAFDGEGARLYGGRWNSPGVAVVYCSDSIPLALLEILLHAGRESLLPKYVLFRAEWEEKIMVDFLLKSLPRDWRRFPPPPSCQKAGDEWVRQKRSAVLRVPSTIHDDVYNYILNPAHTDFGKIRIGKREEIRLDERLRRR
jgi:RES domain-containing protein